MLLSFSEQSQLTMIELFSDTKTKPTTAMRAAMANAEVGDEQAFEDPTVNALCERVAQLLEKEAAMFLPSGAMCNQIALATLGRSGEEVICDRTAHIVCYESGGVAANAGLNALMLDGDRGRFSLAQLQSAIRMPMRHAPRQTIVAVEQTSNLGGGAIWPLAQLNAICAEAKSHRMFTHMDGARLMNAVVASGVSAADYAREFDTVWIDFSKGLGAPVGAALAGSQQFIDEAWRVKQRLGGAMRQAGIIAAGALYALDHHLDRLQDDHDNARVLAQGLSRIPGIIIDVDSIQTNLIYFSLDQTKHKMNAALFCQTLKNEGVRMGALGENLIRAVTHLDVDRAQIGAAIKACERVLV